MQTFLPVADFCSSARFLDRKRLGKQRVEAFQLMVANGVPWAVAERARRTGKTDAPKGWVNHPAAIMWRQYPEALGVYYNECVQEWVLRGHNNTMSFFPKPDLVEMPHWLGNEALHASHRSRLLFKGKLDILAASIAKHAGDRGPNKWLKANGFKEMSTAKQPEYDEILNLLKYQGGILLNDDNFYHQWHWLENDDMEYVWPSEIDLTSDI